MPIPASAQYYILLMSGVNGRVMVRSNDHGNYHMLEQNIQHWRNDLQMVNLSGTGRAPIHSLKAMLIRLMPMRKNERNVFERLDKELPGITSAVLQAILGDRMLPESVAVRALRYIRSQMVSAPKPTISVVDRISIGETLPNFHLLKISAATAATMKAMVP